jgi:hypothetical protein
MKKTIAFGCILTALIVVSSGCNSSYSPGSTNSNSLAANTANTANQTTNTNINTPPSTASTNSAPTSVQPVAKPSIGKADFTVTAIQMFKEYEASEEQAQKKYAGKTVNVTGILREPDLTKQQYGYEVKFETVKMADWVTCYFGEESLEDFKPLKGGQKVTLQGIGEEYWVGGPNLKNCVVVEAK